MAWPLYFAQNLATGTPAAGIGLCLLWTPQERVLPHLPPGSYTLAGNLYSRDGISFLLRNLLANPCIRTLVVCGKDLTASGAALVSLFETGVDDMGCIAGDGTRLHRELPREAVDLVRRSVRLVDARDLVRPDAVAALLADLPHDNTPFSSTPLVFPYSEPAADTLPAETSGFVVRAPTIRAAYLRLLRQVLTFGMRSTTQHSADQRELLTVTTVIDNEPIDPAAFSHADWMPFSRAALGERLLDGSFSGYLGQFLTAGRADPGVSYTYGDRLRNFTGLVDQLATMSMALDHDSASRRAVASLWNPLQDCDSANPPCLNLLQARVREEGGARRLHLIAYFRSHDIYRAWPMNAYGLRALQGLLIEALQTGARLLPGDLTIISASAHIYAHDWDNAQELVAHHERPVDPRLVRDPRGSFVIALEPPEIVVRHYTPDGEHIQTWRGSSARALGLQLAPFVGSTGHAVYLGRELQKAELALQLDRPAAYRQDRDLGGL